MLLQEHQRLIVDAYNSLREATAEMPPNYERLSELRTHLDKLLASAKCESKRIITVFNLKPRPKGKGKGKDSSEATVAAVTDA